MEFSEEVLSSTAPGYSSDGRLLTYSCDGRAVVRDADSLDVLAEFDCAGAVTSARVSPDGQYLLCVVRRSAACHVFDLDHESDWTCRLDEGAVGLSHARWAPDSRHVLTCVVRVPSHPMPRRA